MAFFDSPKNSSEGFNNEFGIGDKTQMDVGINFILFISFVLPVSAITVDFFSNSEFLKNEAIVQRVSPPSNSQGKFKK